MKSFSPAGMAVKAFYGLGARTFGNPAGARTGGGATGGGANPNGPNQGGGGAPAGFAWTARAPVPGSTTLFTLAAGGGVLVGSDGLNVLYRSTDDGVSWPTTHVLGFNTVAIAFGAGTWLTSGGVGAGNAAILARSIDSALTWSESAVFPVNTTTAGLITNGATVVALRDEGGVNGGRVRRSVNTGLTWPALSAFVNLAWLNDTGIHDGVQFVALGLQSTTGFPTVNTSADGLTWVETVLDATGTDGFCNAVVFDAVSGNYMVGLTTANAVRVANTPAGLAAAPNTPTGLTDGGNLWCLGAPGVLFTFGFLGGVADSIDGGATWRVGNLNFPPGSAARAAVLDTLTGVFVVVGDNGAVSTL